ncbi:MAG: ABC transporter permease [Candidatus Enteromonas sp.]|nr:ABC transporter permease [Candidatus Enteromonas sp.]
MAKEELHLTDEVEILDSDFTFVQQDASIHDVKFKTKPTTFFKDAMRRFVKNKSSVVAACILAVIIGMAIVVPMADQNNISVPQSALKYLPPKWFGVNDAGFLDGTKAITDAVLDPVTGLPDPSLYKERAIIKKEGQTALDAISKRTTKIDGMTDSILKYGKGGAIRLRTGGVEEQGTFVASEAGRKTASANLYADDVDASLTFHFDEDYYLRLLAEDTSLFVDIVLEIQKDNPESEEEALRYVLAEKVDLAETEKVVVKPFDNAEFSAKVAELGAPYQTVKFDTVVYSDTLAGSSNSCFLSAITATSSKEVNPFENLVFTDATAQLKKENAFKENALKEDSSYIQKDDGTNTYYYGAVNRSLAQSETTVGTFRYDPYEAAFGEEENYELSGIYLTDFVAKGFIDIDWEGLPNTGIEVIDGVYTPKYATLSEDKYTILDSVHCPILSIESYTKRTTSDGLTTGNIKCTLSLYRYYYYEGALGSCSMPHYLFGTNNNGMDFFKIVFSGLLTSLGLGCLSAVINIFIGLVWGAISGYFGGWTDIIMERFTEILGGMPWIVMMTLIVLLMGSSFWTLLLALCLTGWMGIAHTTRSQFYRFKGREYVLASRTLGASDMRLIFRHILPNGIGTIVTGAVLMIPSVIFTEANIAYLLPGILQYQGGVVSFGITLSDAQAYLTNYPYMIVSASIVMVLIMICFNLFGNGLRDALNPSLKGADN